MNGLTRLTAILGTWGKPVDRPAKWALACALIAVLFALIPDRAFLAVGFPLTLPTKAEWKRRIVVVLAFVAAFLSLGYVAFYLRGGPRIIDATSYFLEGRVLSHGHFAWTVPSPSASFRGRFLFYRELADGTAGKLSVIFPPGFPLLLAAGFLVGAPLVIGPLLAGGLVGATYWLATELAKDRNDVERQTIGILAALLSIVCVALRYHTADTMSHGAAALGVTLALASALRGARSKVDSALPWLGAGLAVGYVVCTRPFSAVAIGAGVLYLALRNKRLGATVLGIIPGALFLVLASHAQTGSWLASTQAAYYAASDGPPGCFRWGFGSGIGCVEEHKDFVAARLSHGYGIVEAALTTLRRLRIHLFDVANFEPLALLVFVPLRAAAGSTPARQQEVRLARLAFGVVVGQILMYAPFYFDGDYPGGGARFFADILPIEHALLAVAAATIATRVLLRRRAAVLVALALLGFAVHGAFEHEALANRETGHPMYDPEEGRSAGKAVVFFDSDHGFDLAYDPYVDATRGIMAARLRNDDHDRLTVERLDRGQAHIYKHDGKHSSLANWSARSGGTRDLWHFEAEADWPPIAQHGGWAEPVWASNSCASDGRVLTLHPAGAGPTATATATIELPVPRTNKWVVSPKVLKRGGPAHGKLRLIPLGRAPIPSDAKLVWEWDDDDAAGGERQKKDVCVDLPPGETAKGIHLDAAGARWELTATGGEVSVDQTTLRWTK